MSRVRAASPAFYRIHRTDRKGSLAADLRGVEAKKAKKKKCSIRRIGLDFDRVWPMFWLEHFHFRKKTQKFYSMKGLYKYRDSANWWFRFTDTAGKRHQLALRTSDEAEAIQRARVIQGQGLLPAVVPRVEPAKTHLSILIDEYIKHGTTRNKKPMRKATVENVKGNLLRFITGGQLQFAQDVNPKNLTAWLDENKTRGRSQDTLFTYARDICAFSKWLHKAGHTAFDPLASYERPQMGTRGRRNWLRMADVKCAIDSCEDPDLKFVLYCGFHAGLRKAEICAVRVGWFDFHNPEEPVLHVQNDPAAGFLIKDRDNRAIPITREFHEFLKVYLKDQLPQLPTNYALCPKKAPGKSKYRVEFRKAFDSHMARLGLKCTIHDMRRSFASNLVSLGEPIYSVAAWLGDRVDVVQRSYGHLKAYLPGINRLTA
jgi:integrase